jgi:hypothetical protein
MGGNHAAVPENTKERQNPLAPKILCTKNALVRARRGYVIDFANELTPLAPMFSST